jgi:hypothetical protein
MDDVDKRGKIPKDVQAQWEKKLKADGLGAELEMSKGVKSALEALDLNADTLQALRFEIYNYLASREEYYGSHNKTVKELAGKFALQDQKLIIEQAIEESQRVMTDIQYAIGDAMGQKKSERAVLRVVQEAFPDVPMDAIGILYDRQSTFRRGGLN